MEKNKIFVNTYYQVIGKVVTSLFGFVSTYYLTRYLGGIKFSEYSFIFTFIGFAAIFADLGFGSLITRNFATKVKSEESISDFFTLRLILSIIVSLFSILLIIFLPYTNTIKIGVAIASFYNISSLLSSIFWAVFQANLDFRKVVISQIVNSVVFFVLLIIGMRLNLFFEFFLFANVVASFAALVISIKLNNSGFNLIEINIKKFKKILYKVLPFAGGFIVSVAYFKIDSILLSFYYNPSFKPDVGLYAISYRFFEVVLVFGGFFTQTLYPFFSKNISSENFSKNVKKYFKYSLAISILSTIFLYFLAKPLVLTLGGDKFIASYPSLQILSFAGGVTILSGFFLSIALSGFKEVLLFKFSIIALLINVFLNLLIIPKYSFIGASWTTLITQSFILIANAFAAYLVVRKSKNC
ncbi:flippase [Candidatus Microgenomates bacterium]|nr:MAG: flippase [Candidatus Microgenomates bacterium]